MREGTSPAKEAARLSGYAPHRAIVPVYVPELQGYFARLPEVLEVCLGSLWSTTRGRIAITAIANGCVSTVVRQLEKYLSNGWLDQLMVNSRNRGKVDAVLSVARGSWEPLITVSDCDVLFRPGWVEAVHDVFLAFPECGTVAPIPAPNCLWRHTSATWLGALLRRELEFADVLPPADLARMGRSLGDEDRYRANMGGQLTVRRGQSRACVGAGHCLFTMRREVLQGVPPVPCLVPIGRGSEEAYLDAPPDRLGMWRLATPGLYAQHIGNVPEPWMHGEVSRLLVSGQPEPSPLEPPPPVPTTWEATMPVGLRRFVLRVLGSRRVRPFVLRRLGHPGFAHT